MNLLSALDKLIVEHGSSVVLKEQLSLFKDEISILSRKLSEFATENSDLKSENENLKQQLNIFQNGNPYGFTCDHCGSGYLK